MSVLPIPVRMGPMTVMAYALLGERVVLVDTGVAEQAPGIVAALGQAGRRLDEVSLILLTHGHGDHAGSAAALREMTGAPIALGAGDEEKCRRAIDPEMRGRGATGRAALAAIRARQRLGTSAGPEADIIVEDEFPLAAYGVDAYVLPLPGHTRGSLGVFTGEGDAIVGDLIGGGGMSREQPTPGIFFCDDAAVERSIATVIGRRPRLVYTGHDVKPFTLDQMERAFG